MTLYTLRGGGRGGDARSGGCGDHVDEGGAKMKTTSLPSTHNVECRPY